MEDCDVDADVDVRDPDEKSIMTYVSQFLQYSRDLPVAEEEMQVCTSLSLNRCQKGIYSHSTLGFWSGCLMTAIQPQRIEHVIKSNGSVFKKTPKHIEM